MNVDHPHSTSARYRRPLHAPLVPFPIVCFTLTLLADIAYWQTSNLMWQHFAEWLLLVGLLVGGIAALAELVDWLIHRQSWSVGPLWPHVLGSIAVLLLALVNSFVHAGDGWTAVVPTGLILSAATVVVMIVTDWFGRSLMHRNVAGVISHE